MRRFSPFYLAYMGSSAWQYQRQLALIRAGFRCQVCGVRKGLQVHHVTYENLGREKPEDLTVLCWQCHLLATWWIRLRRAWRRIMS